MSSNVHLNLLVIIKVVKKCCATHCQGNYTKDKQGKVFRQYRKVWKKESFGCLLYQRYCGFQRVSKDNSGMKWVNDYITISV